MSDKFNHIKSTIGLLINYYRKSSIISVENFIFGNDEYFNQYCKSCEKCETPTIICSKSTLYRLEKGKQILNECVYERLANKLGKKVIIEHYDIYEKLENYKNLLINNLTNFSKINLDTLKANIELDLKKYENVLYVYEVLVLYYSIVQYQLSATFNISDENVKIFLILKDHLSEDHKKLILYFLYNHYYRIGVYGRKLNEVINEINNYIEEPLFFRMKLDQVYEMDLLSGYNYLTNLKQTLENSLTLHQKYLLYCSFEYIQVNTGSFKGAYDSQLKCLEIIDQSDFGEITRFSCYTRLGFDAYCLGLYEKSVEWFIKAFEVRNWLSNYLSILCSALEKTEQFETIKDIIEKTNFSKMKAPYGKAIYTYYKIKYSKKNKTKKDIIELEDYICKKLKPHFDTYGQIHKNIFNEDLKKYVKISGNYKKYCEFS